METTQLESALSELQSLDLTSLEGNPLSEKFLQSAGSDIGLEVSSVKHNQKGGFVGAVVQMGAFIIMEILKNLLTFLAKLAKQLFSPYGFLSYINRWKHMGENRGLFWKYIIFAIKCGLYLCVFALGGPIFIIIGIVMVYKKLGGKILKSDKLEAASEEGASYNDVEDK